MYLMTGRKKWRFWDREQVFNLYLKPFSSHFRFRAFEMDTVGLRKLRSFL